MEVHNLGLWVLVFLVFHEVFDCRHMREAYHPKFAVKAASHGVKDLIFLLRSMPHYRAVSHDVQLGIPLEFYSGIELADHSIDVYLPQ